MTVNIKAKIQSPNVIKIGARVQNLNSGIHARLSQGIIYAFSPTALVELIDDTYYLITITDKNGTTTAEIPALTDSHITSVVANYFANNPIIENAIQEHNQSEQAHEYIRQLILDAISHLVIPTRVSELINDEHYLKTFKEQLIPYPSKYEFPNIPPEGQRDMIFLDASTGDMYVFGLNNNASYSSIGIANKDAVYGGDASSNFDN